MAISFLLHVGRMNSALDRYGDKPRLRGVSHLFATVLALIGGAYLLAVAPPGATPPVLVYVAGLVALFGVSALYHKPMWPPAVRQFLRRLDHSTIFVFIAASYTPICLLALGPDSAGLLTVVWIFAAAGVAKSLLWPGAPRFLTAALYVAMGWLSVINFSSFPAALGTTGLVLLVAGGVLYTVGAVTYATKWPEPVPGVFGHHEVFHAFVIGAAGLHFVMMRAVVLGS